MKLNDVTGQRFGRLVVLEKAAPPKMWRCICDCGNETLAASSPLRSGKKRSCGCLLTDWSREMGANPVYVARRTGKTTRHGHKRTTGMSAEYRTWLGLKRRCSDPAHKDYPNWGGRGIKVCDRWSDSFEAFLADMGRRPEGAWSIDRINHDGNYEPRNCRWVEAHMQAAEHTRRVEAVTVAGVEYPSISAACRAYNLGKTTVSERRKAGWTGDAVFTTPLRASSKPRQAPPQKIGHTPL